MTENLTVLAGSEAARNAGTFVLENQTVAAGDGFRNVSKIWYDKTISYEDGLGQIEAGKAVTEDILCVMGDIVPTVGPHNDFVMRYKDGRDFKPTAHAICQMGNWAGTGTWYVNSLLTNPVDNKDRETFKRDRGDAEALAFALRNGLRRLDPAKKFLFRTRQDGTLRAMLTERYAIVDNRWYVEKLREFVPSGRLSHWRGDSDTIYGNVLIPDTIRAERDSEYGGMLSIGNSEIGERRVSSVPSIFRAICMNGCIWGQTKGEGIRQVHRGKIDLAHLAADIKTNLGKQIPLLPAAIDTLLGLRSLTFDCGAKSVIAQLAKDYKLTKGQGRAVLDGYAAEVAETPEYAGTLFAVVSAVTRSGQKLSNAEWLTFDEIGGELARFEASDFTRLVNRAKSLSVKDLEETLGLA